MTNLPQNVIAPEGAAEPFDPVGEIISVGQLAVELKIAGQRLEIQAGVMKQWSERFTFLSATLHHLPTQSPLSQGGEARRDALEAAAQIADSFRYCNCGMDGKIGEAIRALANVPQGEPAPGAEAVAGYTSAEWEKAREICKQSCRAVICNDGCKNSYPGPGYGYFAVCLKEARAALRSPTRKRINRE